MFGCDRFSPLTRTRMIAASRSKETQSAFGHRWGAQASTETRTHGNASLVRARLTAGSRLSPATARLRRGRPACPRGTSGRTHAMSRRACGSPRGRGHAHVSVAGRPRCRRGWLRRVAGRWSEGRGSGSTGSRVSVVRVVAGTLPGVWLVGPRSRGLAVEAGGRGAVSWVLVHRGRAPVAAVGRGRRAAGRHAWRHAWRHALRCEWGPGSHEGRPRNHAHRAAHWHCRWCSCGEGVVGERGEGVAGRGSQRRVDCCCSWAWSGRVSGWQE